MDSTDLIHESGEFSLELTKILTKAGIIKFSDLKTYTRFGLKTEVPKLKVRHLVDLVHALNSRGLQFQPDDSIWLDIFINQRKLFNLWEDGIFTYEQLDAVSTEEFQFYMGGPSSRFFRNRTGLAARWLSDHNMSRIQDKKKISPWLSERTSSLLWQAKVDNLKELVNKSDYELALMLQPDFKARKRALPMTVLRITEIKYALMKEGVDRPFTPL